MKKIFIFLSVSILALNLMSQDWRKGRYLHTVPEYLVSVNTHAKMVMGDNAMLNPWGYGFTLEYLYKTGRPKDMLVSVAHGVGGHLGLSYFPGLVITQEAIGAYNPIRFDKFNSYNYMPIMATYNLFITTGLSHFIIGIDAGVNMMIRERDNKEGNYVSFHDSELNALEITRFLPSFSGYLGYSYELSTNFRLKAKVGVDYIMGYEYDGYREEYSLNEDGTVTSKIFRGHMTASGLLNLSASIGVAYSL